MATSIHIWTGKMGCTGPICQGLTRPFSYPYPIIDAAAKDFLRGYTETHVAGTTLTLVIGTSNCVDSLTRDQSGNQICPPQAFGDGYTNSEHGQAWANMISDLNDWIDLPPSWRGWETAWGGSDIEPDWSSFGEAVDWAGGYNFIYQQWAPDRRWRYVDYGSADGCPPYGPCDNVWTQYEVKYVAYSLAAAWTLPDVYRTDGGNAEQWQQISELQGFDAFLGSTTQLGACTTNGPCPGIDNPPDVGWRQFWTLLNGRSVTATSLTWSTDLSWNTN